MLDNQNELGVILGEKKHQKWTNIKEVHQCRMEI